MNLPHQITFPLLGAPVTFASNAPQAIELARSTYGGWAALDAGLITVPPARLDIVVEPRDGLPPRSAGLTILRADARYEAHAGSVLMTCELATRRAEARLPATVLDEDPAWYRWFVNGLALLPASQHDRCPLHAAAFVIGDTAVVVLGSSGRGKSTLAYAACRAGHRLLQEDTVFVAIEGGLRLWAHLDRLCLAPDTVRWFGELADLPPTVMPHGKQRLVVPLEAFGIRPALTQAGPMMLVELLRHNGSAACEPIEAAGLVDTVFANRETGFDMVRQPVEPVAATLRALPAYRVLSGPDPRATVAALEALVAARSNGGFLSR